MRSLLAAAVGVAAALSHHVAAAPRVDTLYSAPGSIAAFAQDGQLVSWFSTRSKGCNVVYVRSVANGITTTLPEQGRSPNVTCVWRVGDTPVRLAAAGNRVAWTLRQQEPIPFDYLLGASTASRKERRFQEFAHTKRGVGLWLGGITGDGDTLVYGIASVDYVDEAGCLAGTGSCALRTTGGGVYRMIGRQTPKLLPGTAAAGAVMVSASSGAVAYVPSSSVAKDGRPAAGADLPIEIVDATTGDSIARAMPQGIPLAISLTGSLLAALERTSSETRIAWYDRATGTARGSVAVPPETTPLVTANDHAVVFRVGRSIRAVDVATSKIRVLATAPALPIGLSLEGNRLAWAENLKGTGRIRALVLAS
ncbi:MAG TPA: hypothetical protein VFA56_13975 [Gaiellaceae bacterium]|nr:hypothetical protein [Gaiellaceae bacterium]